ncbi:MAG TPA: immunoglobulin domain-containing protein [Candidatus Acidoferrales bacterium]|jgi:sugar lactone lactonase YvrE|nr:immunoglobulin domain-containing protein [Candidatus Acidoferrales bacterium]
MKSKKYRLMALLAGTLALSSLNSPAQTAPTISTEPASRTNAAGTSATFIVTADGTGPLTYQWFLNSANHLDNNVITNIAGIGATNFSGDNGAATNATFKAPQALAFDVYGNLYIADTTNNRVRMIDTNGIISTFAGNGTATYAGDGGPATNASLSRPQGIAFDAAGNLYIADRNNSRIRRVGIDGVIITVAGSGTRGYSGNGILATNANLSFPSGVALDGVGNLFIADAGNHRIRKVNTSGIITTVAGNGTATYAGDTGAATNASFSGPQGVTVDGAGNLYVADTGNNRVRKVYANGTVITVAGNSGNGFSGDAGSATNAGVFGPTSVILDSIGNLYIADRSNHRIRKVGINGIITTLAGNGTNTYAGGSGVATNASLNFPSSVAFDASGNLYIADQSNERIREVLSHDGYPTLTVSHVDATNAGDYLVVITNAYGCATSTVATLTVQVPPVITVPPSNQLATVGTSPSFSVTVADSGPFGYAWYFASTNPIPAGTNALLALSNVSANDAGNYKVVITNAYGSVTSQVASLTVGFPPSVTNQPVSQSVFLGTNASFIVGVNGTGPFTYQWQCNGTNLPNNINIITTFAGKGGIASYSGDGGQATNAGLSKPEGVLFDAAGNLYIADNDNNRIRKVDTNGIITTVMGNGIGAFAGDDGPATSACLNSPNNLAFDAAGNLYIADNFNQRIRKVDTNGIITTVAGNGKVAYSGDGGAATNAGFHYPVCVNFDPAGNMYIADLDNQRIRKMDTNGIITTVAGNGIGPGNVGAYSGDGGAATNAGMGFLQGVAADALGNLYIADTYDGRIRKVDTNSIITTVAGKGSVGPFGDGGPATNGDISLPWSVLPDKYGNFYLADYDSGMIRKVDANGIITTVAGHLASGFTGDGGSATSAQLRSPACVTLDPVGNLFIADGGNNRIRKVQLVGYPTVVPTNVFNITNVNALAAGNYTVIITSAYGSTTSAVATLTVTIPTTPPQIVANDAKFGFLTNQFGFNLSGAFGQTVVVDGSTNLIDWYPLFTNTVGNAPFYFSDPTSTNFYSQFYRARLQ